MQGKQLGPYRLLSELGSGGMGKVYLAENGQRVALKVLHPHFLESQEAVERFKREAEIGQRVRHDNVVHTLDVGSATVGDSTHHYLVMEYVEGQTLRGLLEELGRVPEELCRHIGREVAKGLEAIHGAGVVHRDLKPENVLITEEHVVKVMDLGVARLQDAAFKLSQTGAFLGSVLYAAPELFHGDVPDARADFYSLGLVLYELATGRHPFRADTFADVLHRQLQDEPRPAAELNPQLSPFFEEVCKALLEKDRGNRVGFLPAGEESEWWGQRARAIRLETKRPLRRIRVPRETALYGRDDDLARLAALYASAKAGEGRVLLLDGEAGIGKTRLVDEFVGGLQRDGEDLNFLFGSYPPGGAATAAGAFTTAYREHFGHEGLDETLPGYLTATPALVPAFGALLRGESTPKGEEALTKDSLQAVFVHATHGLAAERPTIILIDDLHFAPEEGRALFAALAQAAPGHPVLLVGTMRPGVQEEWIASMTRLEQCEQFSLARLGAKDLMRLLKDSFQSDRLAEELGVKIAMKSDGNPFFAFEIIEGLREGQFITRGPDGTWVTTRVIKEIQIPSSVLDLVNARVAELTTEDRDLVDVAACRGFRFDPTLVGDVCGIGPIPVLKRLGQIERRHRLVRSTGRDYAFDHHQVQEALYGALNERLRQHYHAKIATALEARERGRERAPEELGGALCADLCDQFLKGELASEAVRYFDVALAHLEDGFLNAEAAALAQRVLAVEGLLDPIRRAKTLLRLAKLLTYIGDRAPARSACEEAQGIARAEGDTALTARATLALGRNLLLTSGHAEAEPILRRAVDAARQAGDKTTEGDALGSLSLVHFFQDRLEDAQQRIEEAGVVRRDAGDRRGEADQAGSMAEILFARGRADEARTYFERSIALSREIGYRRGEARATGNLGVVVRDQGRLDEARQFSEQHLALSRATGNRAGEAIALGSLGALARDLGHLEESRRHLERYLAYSQEIGNRRGESIALLNLGITLTRLGDAAALDRLRESHALATDIGVRQVAAAAGVAIGEFLLAKGDVEAAREALSTARAVAEESDSTVFLVIVLCNLALLPGGQVEPALEAFAAHRDRLTGETRRHVRLLLWKATGDREHLEEAKRLLDEAVALVSEEHRKSMLENVPLHRDITNAWAERGGA